MGMSNLLKKWFSSVTANYIFGGNILLIENFIWTMLEERKTFTHQTEKLLQDLVCVFYLTNA